MMQNQEVFCKKDILGNVTKFTGKHLCQSLFLNKVAGLNPFLIKLQARTPFFTEHLWWLLLRIEIPKLRNFNIKPTSDVTLIIFGNSLPM